MYPIDIKKFLLEHREIQESTGCWLYTGYITNNGYGMVNINGTDYLVHRLSFREFVHEPINLILHKQECLFKHCFNPEHLYDGTHTDNMNDQLATGNHGNQYGNTNKLYCKNGHPLFGDNLKITSEGRRRYLTCQKEYNKKNWKKYTSSYISHKMEK